MSGWGCPNELQGLCLRVKGRACDPGMKGCVLHGRFVFSDPAKNRPPAPGRPESPADRPAPGPRPDVPFRPDRPEPLD